MKETTVSVTESTTPNPDGEDYEQVQYRTTIPKDIAESLEMDRNTTLEWEIGGESNKLELTIHNNITD
ncbi:AbrB/MazE/SpoVT family DNA-binding domain-containing protein [Natronococcus sp. JC468]|uniref:AbrB/MazE/SpoVT family DNA-binding domain-containing protein n=1 Tax=Natronococcus sp. JC468 TaxID=1961921 RepID=UPI00143BA7F9|nr:AbrB/MazE/SpoVT family DNA-binding domain-containing protein [Natronococcus sp. JC468]NKE38038.1 AbrB/MazE/SpoVT family DNA-binding domain-containing protein [Natronococcus sp. JC468]